MERSSPSSFPSSDENLCLTCKQHQEWFFEVDADDGNGFQDFQDFTEKRREKDWRNVKEKRNISDTAGVQKYMKISSLSLPTTCNIYLYMTFAFPTALHHHHHDGNHLSFSSYVVLVVCLISQDSPLPDNQKEISDKRVQWSWPSSSSHFHEKSIHKSFLPFHYFFLPFTSYNNKKSKAAKSGGGKRRIVCHIPGR